MTTTTFAASARGGRSVPGRRASDEGEGRTEMGDHAGRLSVLIPVYNEERTVGEILDRVLALGPVVKEVVVVDDGSKDRTAEIVRGRAEAEPKIHFFQSPQNRGKTAAIRKALELATGEIVIIQDADLEYDPAEIPEVIEPLVLTSKGFGMEVEITALVCKTKARTYEVPISYYGRAYEEGKKIGFMDGVAALWYIGYYNLVKPLLPSGRRYVKAVNEALAQQGV